ncbi:MAG: hypothetical protein JW774_07050 [Candidatus Aureabacteria bacterium]|nr:hypothetical protein [Candidatus Auribacterota bacterium]
MNKIPFAGIAACLTLYLFWPSLEYGFFWVDDFYYVQQNECIRHLFSGNLFSLFTRGFYILWTPLTTLSFGLDYLIWKGGPFGYHLTNCILHLTNIYLVFYLFKRSDQDLLTAFIASLFFAVHPVQIESVAWISERKTLLCFLFFLIGCHYWKSFLKSSKLLQGGLAVVFHLLSVLSKPLLLLAPLLWFLEAFLIRVTNSSSPDAAPSHLIGRSAKTRLLTGIGLAISFFSLSMTLHYLSREKAFFLPLSYTLTERILTALTLPWYYVKNIFWPVSLSISYLPETAVFFLHPKVLFGGMVLLGIITCFYFGYRRKSPVAYWIFWIGIGLAPVSTVIAMPTWLNDRYLYVPLAAAAILLVNFTRRVFSARRLFILFWLIVIILLGMVSRSQLTLWKNPMKLLEASMKRDPRSFQSRGWYLHGYLKFQVDNGNPAEKILSAAKKILENDPHDPYAVYCVVRSLIQENKLDEALQRVSETLKRHPDAAYLNRVCGNLYLAKCDYQRASFYYSAVPDKDKQESSQALLDQIRIMLRLKDHEKALLIGKMAAFKIPDRPEIFLLLAECEQRSGEWGDSLRALQKGVRLHPENEDLRHALIRTSKQLSLLAPSVES